MTADVDGEMHANLLDAHSVTSPTARRGGDAGIAGASRERRSTTRFLDLAPRGEPSGVAVVVIPGAGWGASTLQSVMAPLADAGHHVVLCDPRGSAANPGSFRYEDLRRDCASRVERLAARRIAVLAHSMGAHTAACLAARDARVEQVWLAPVLDGRRCFARLHATGFSGELHRVFFREPLAAAERGAVEALATDAWLDPTRFAALDAQLSVPSHGAVRVPSLADFLREVAHPGYVLRPRMAVRLRRVLVSREDVWAPLDAARAFCAEASVPLIELARAHGHGARGGWPEIVEHLGALLVR